VERTNAREAAMPQTRKQNAIVSPSAEVIEVDLDAAQERATTSAIARLARGLHLGGGRLVGREKLHERQAKMN
jgi:hypothetical protein